MRKQIMATKEKQDVTKSAKSLSPCSNKNHSMAATVTDYLYGFQLFAVLLALLLGMFLVALDVTIIATAIPKITDEFQSIKDIGWYAAAFFLMLAVFQSLWGRAYKHFELKPVFLTTICLFEIGSLMCGLAQNSTTLIVGRAIAGLGGAGITGGIYTIIAFIIPPPKVPAYLGLVGATFCIASVAGPLLGGVFTQQTTWRWAFYINLPLGAVSVLLLLTFFRRLKATRPVPITWRRFLQTLDLLSVVVLLGSIICFSLAMEWGGTVYPWSSSQIVGATVGSVLMAAIFCILQWQLGEQAMLVPRLFKQRTTAALCLFIFLANIPYLWLLTQLPSLNAANQSIVYSLPQYLQVIKGFTPLESGLFNIPMIFTTAFAALPAAVALGHVGYYQPFLILGAVLLTIGTSLLYTLDDSSSMAKIIGYQIPLGLGVGCSLQVPVITAQAFAASDDIAIVTSLILFFQLLTGAISVAAMQALLTNRLISTLNHLAPHLNPQSVVSIGATDIRTTFQGDDLGNVLQAYMIGLKDAWAMSITLSGLTLFAALLGERKSISKNQH